MGGEAKLFHVNSVKRVPKETYLESMQLE